MERIEHRRLNLITAGRKLREMRSQNTLGLREMARAIGYDPSVLSKVERGIIPAPTKMVLSYVGLSGLNHEQAEVTMDELKLLYGRAPNLPVDLAHPLAEIWHTMKKVRQ